MLLTSTGQPLKSTLKVPWLAVRFLIVVPITISLTQPANEMKGDTLGGSSKHYVYSITAYIPGPECRCSTNINITVCSWEAQF